MRIDALKVGIIDKCPFPFRQFYFSQSRIPLEKVLGEHQLTLF
jgi:hypothetical protein